MNKKYILEIYHPASTEDVEAIYESETPFMNLNVGDLINSKMWHTGTLSGKILKVVKLEHFIWDANGIVKHKIGVLTAAVNDEYEERFKQI